MNYQKPLGIGALILFAGIFVLSAYRLAAYGMENRVQEAAFEKLEERVDAATASATAPPPGEEAAAPVMLPEYATLYEENPDLFGWVQIEGTKLDYPVMYTPDEPEYYLRRAFDRSESISGVPFLDASWTEGCGNYLIYGHNMLSGAMFAALLSYAQSDFYEEHPIIRFDTLFDRGKYEVIAAFYSKVYDAGDQNVFRYYQYTDLSAPERFQEYMSQVKDAALYDTGVTAQYGDQLLTLSTCSYHTDNGRFAVVARKIDSMADTNLVS